MGPSGLEVIIPSIRVGTVERALYSLSRNSIPPDLVTVVSNEVPSDARSHGLAVRVLRFSSEHYPIGECDLALRRNIGIWAAEHPHVLTFDDDQLAPRGLIASSIELLRREPYFWGHHRFIRFGSYTIDQILEMDPDRGRTREFPANAWHSWQSCYGGLFGGRKDVVLEAGGYDLIFLGICRSEDQNFGRRLARRVRGTDRVFIYEPPFAWHPEEKYPWAASPVSNLCSTKHELAPDVAGGAAIVRCGRCPYFRVDDGQNLFRDEVFFPFDPARVDIRMETLA